jgi:Ca2+/Na+ antiporter
MKLRVDVKADVIEQEVLVVGSALRRGLGRTIGCAKTTADADPAIVVMLIFAWPNAIEEVINTIKTLRAARQ